MSTAVMAIVAAMNSVMQPIDGDHQQRLGRENRIERGPPGYTPAATIVAE